MYTIPPVLRQVYASSGTICLFLTQGYILGLQSVMLPKIRGPNSGITLDLNQESWIMVASILTTFPTQLISSYLAYSFGRKPILYMATIPLMLSLILMYYCNDYPTLLATFAIFGLGGGGLSVGTMLVAESTSPKYRNVLLNTKAVASSVGTILAHSLGSCFDWRSICLFGLIPGYMAFAAAVTSPESPPWFASKGRFEACQRAFQWLRGNGDKIELEKLIESQKNKNTDHGVGLSFTKKKLTSFTKFVTNRVFLKSMLICFACILVLDLNGKVVFANYVIDALTAIFGSETYAYYGAVGIDVIEVVTLSISCISAKCIKQRAILFKAGFSALLILLAFCLLSFLFANNLLPVHFRWCTLPLILVYFSLLNIGVLPFLFAILNEVVPLSHRELGLGFTSVMFIGFLFCSVKLTPYLMKYCDLHGTFLINACIISISLTYLYYFLPETHCKTLHDIEMEMKQNERTLDSNEEKCEVHKELMSKSEI